MAQHYSDPRRASDPHALPDIEVFHHDCTESDEPCPYQLEAIAEFECERGWYWWSCCPGCLPDGDPTGPFETEAEALADARDGLSDEEGCP
jgi:hypothetical protein